MMKKEAASLLFFADLMVNPATALQHLAQNIAYLYDVACIFLADARLVQRPAV